MIRTDNPIAFINALHIGEAQKKKPTWNMVTIVISSHLIVQYYLSKLSAASVYLVHATSSTAADAYE